VVALPWIVGADETASGQPLDATMVTVSSVNEVGQQRGTQPTPTTVGLAPVLRYFVRLGTIGFGGPIATVGYMQRDLVEQRRWMSKQDLLDGIALGQTMPGPLAAQVAMWVGFLRRGALGALGTAAAFIAPSFLLVLAIGYLYVRYQGLPAVQSLFYGISPAVIAIVVLAAWKLARLTDGKDRRLWVISVVVGAATAVTGTEVALLIVAAGLVILVWDAPPGLDALAAGSRRARPTVASRARVTAV